jgi:uridine kinase
MDSTLKTSLPRSEELLDHIVHALTPRRLPLLIVIDGADGCGKSSLASWLAWQLEMPTVHLDLYMTATAPIQWRTEDLDRAIDHRLFRERPVIVEGILALDALEQIGRRPDFIVFVAGKSRSRFFSGQIKDYRRRKRPCGNASFVIRGAAGITS